jgi:formate hydrogenlyase transcriptional activator
MIERSAILSQGDVFTVDPAWLRHEFQQSRTIHLLAASIADRDKAMIEAALTHTEGRVAGPSGAAARLGIPRQTLDSKISSLQIRKERFKRQD